MKKKYIIQHDGSIRALRSFGAVQKGEIGGRILCAKGKAPPCNVMCCQMVLSHYGNCWIPKDTELNCVSRCFDNSNTKVDEPEQSKEGNFLFFDFALR